MPNYHIRSEDYDNLIVAFIDGDDIDNLVNIQRAARSLIEHVTVTDEWADLSGDLGTDEYNRRVQEYNDNLERVDKLAFGLLDALAAHIVGSLCDKHADDDSDPVVNAARAWLARDVLS